MNREVYIDLEMTVIDNFQNGRLMNVEMLKYLIHSGGDQNNLRVFSFAIFDEQHRQDFIHRLQPAIEEALDVKIVEVVTIREMIQADLAYSGCRFDPDNGCDVTDWLSIRGKIDGFRNYVLNKQARKTRYVLVDDVVPNMEMRYVDNKVRLYYINVDAAAKVFKEWKRG